MSDCETLTQKRPKLVRIALGAAYSFGLLNVIGGFIVVFATDISWLIGLFSLLAIPLIAFCVYLLKMNRDPELTLTPTGFSERTEIDYRAFNWSDVERFEVYSFRARSQTRTRVGFNFSESFRSSPAYKKVRLTAKTERAMTGYDWHLSNFYGKAPAQLTALLNQRRQARL